MARIRSIYPSTPTDPEFAAIPVEGRLLFIYSWTLSDDAGNFERNPLGLKMALFPGDEWATPERITELVETLIVGRFYEPYEVDGKQYLHVRNFSKYQKPDHPTAPRYPLYPGQEYTYHVRQGNGWGTKTEQGPLPERTPKVPRKYKERSRRIGSGLGSGLGLGSVEERIGLDGRGPGGEEKADARPLALGGQAASSSSKGNGNGQSVGEGDNLSFIEGLSRLKKDALVHAITQHGKGEWGSLEITRHLEGAGFQGRELERARGVIPTKEATN